jgi:hypothetical protein
LSEDTAPGPIRLALVIEDPALADRLAALLAGVPGLRLVGATEAADAAVVPSTAVSPSVDGDVPLTPRELEVLALLAEGASNHVGHDLRRAAIGNELELGAGDVLQ